MAGKVLKVGDSVSWNSTQGQVVGTVKKKLTAPIEVKTHHVAASPENPEFLVASAKTGQLAAHKPKSLKRVAAVKRVAAK